MITCANKAHGLGKGGGYEPLPEAGEYVCDCYEHGTGEPWAHVGSSHVHERIVRCRDCRHYTPESMTRECRGVGVYEDVWEPGGCFNPKRCSICGDPFGEWHVVGIDTEPNGFCAWGERRDA